jgi:haloalkane dehalogenase
MAMRMVRAPARGPVDNRRTLPDWVDPVLYPFVNRWVTVGGANVHYVDEGRGMTLLFLHAAPAWSFIYREFIRDLSRDYRCVAVDFPGFGLSSAPSAFRGRLEDHAGFLAEFMMTLGLDKIILVVHDSSGSIGLRVAAEHPNWFAGLVLTDTVVWPLDRHPLVGTILRIVGSPLFGFFDDRFGLLVNSVVRVGPVRRGLSPAERLAYTGAFASREARRRMRAMLAGLVHEKKFMRSVEAGLERIAHIPALVIFGEKDPIRRLGFDKKLASRFRNVESAVIAGEKHFPHEGAPGDMVKVIRDWLRRFPIAWP